MRGQNLRRFLPLFFLPVLLAWTALSIHADRGPFWLGENSDPEYAYLLNGLNLCHGKSPGLYQHPGTPFQMFLAVILAATFLATGKDSTLASDVLTRPEHYLNSAWLSLTVLDVVGCLLAGYLAFQARNSIVLGLCIQSTLFLANPGLDALGRVTPERFLTLGGIAYALLLLHSRQEKQSNWFLLAAPLLLGFLVATKLTSLPLLIIPFFLVKGWRLRVRLLALTTVAFLAFTAPILHYFLAFLGWTGALLTHTGLYGGGDSGILEPHQYLSSLEKLVNYNPLFIGLLLMSLGLIASAKVFPSQSQLSAEDFRVALAVCISQVLQLAMVAKHPNQHYLIPALMLLGLNLAFVLGAAQSLHASIRLVIYVLLLLGARNLVNYSNGRHMNLIRMRDLQLEIATWKPPTALPTVYYYRCSSIAYALFFGDSWANHQSAAELQSKYPKDVIYNIWTAQYGRMDGQPTQLNGTYHFRGTPFEGANQKFLPPKIQLTPLKTTPMEAVYEAKSEPE